VEYLIEVLCQKFIDGKFNNQIELEQLRRLLIDGQRASDIE